MKNYIIQKHPTLDIFFLNRINHRGEILSCVGSADKEVTESGRWRVTINAPYDPETDSDACLIGYFDNKDEARKTLWTARYQTEFDGWLTTNLPKTNEPNEEHQSAADRYGAERV